MKLTEIIIRLIVVIIGITLGFLGIYLPIKIKNPWFLILFIVGALTVNGGIFWFHAPKMIEYPKTRQIGHSVRHTRQLERLGIKSS